MQILTVKNIVNAVQSYPTPEVSYAFFINSKNVSRAFKAKQKYVRCTTAMYTNE